MLRQLAKGREQVTDRKPDGILEPSKFAIALGDQMMLPVHRKLEMACDYAMKNLDCV